ncbi:MAG TPA: winged helix-turn-helix domain-containing protein [Thermoanaerobaculia bacterium]|nr:winged helix-turn-helix domain-containing protein [Thermoanaerobaculia bacterium]
MAAIRRVFEFDGFRADLGDHLLYRGEGQVTLTPKAFDTLAALLERHGQVVEKDELLARVWPGTFVEEATLTQNVYTLRKVLADAGASRNWIETVPKRGYRFVAPVVEIAPKEPAAAPLSPLGSPAAAETPRLALRLRIALLIAVGLAGIAAVWHSTRPGAGSSPPAALHGTVRSLAVLPFEPLRLGAPLSVEEDAYLGLGMADALITRLSNLKSLAVRPTSSVRRYNGTGRDLAGIARELKVDAVLDGSFQRDGDRLRVSVQLVAASDSAPLWAAQYDARAAGLFELQDAISQKLAAELNLELTRQEWARLSEHGTENPQAYEHYARGRYFWNRRNATSLEQAIASFRQAIALDPAYAPAWAGLADCYVLLPLYANEPPVRAFPEALAAAERALALDPELAEARTSRAYAHFVYERRYDEAEAGFRRAIATKPGYSTAHQWYAFLLSALGRHEDAEAEARRALELDPLSLIVNADLGMVLQFGRKTEAAISQLERTLELDPSFSYARFGLGHAYQQQGRLEAAVAELRRAVEAARGTTALQAALGQALARTGRPADREEAQLILRELEKRAKSEYVDPSHPALIRAGLGEKTAALRELAQAVEERSRFVVFLQSWSLFDDLRGEAGWEELVRTAGLEVRP